MFSDRTEQEARSGMKFHRVLLAAAVTAGAATFAQQSPPPVLRGALETALDRNTTLVIGRHPIARALELVTQHTQVPLVITPRTTALLPYGAETQMSLTIRGIPLREGLAGMLRPVAMTFVVRNEHIEIIPTPPLRPIKSLRPSLLKSDPSVFPGESVRGRTKYGSSFSRLRHSCLRSRSPLR